MSTDAGNDLEATVAAAREATLRLRDRAAELARVLERLDLHGGGPPEAVAEQERLLTEIERTLAELRELDRREAELRDS